MTVDKLTIEFDSPWDARQFFELCEREGGRASLSHCVVAVDVSDDLEAAYYEKAAAKRGGRVSR